MYSCLYSGNGWSAFFLLLIELWETGRSPRSLPHSLRELSRRNDMQMSLPESSWRAPEELPELSRRQSPEVSQKLIHCGRLAEDCYGRLFGRSLRETFWKIVTGDLLGDLREISRRSPNQLTGRLFGRPNLHVISPGELPETSPGELLEIGYILLWVKFSFLLIW